MAPKRSQSKSVSAEEQPTLDSLVVDVTANTLDSLVIPTYEFYGATSLPEVAELTSIDDDKLASILKKTASQDFQFRHTGPEFKTKKGNKYLFKLSDVVLSGVINGSRDQSFSFTSVSNVKLPFKISELQQAKIDRWYQKMFPGLIYKPTSLYNDPNYVEPHSCRPYSVLQSGLSQMKVNVRRTCTIQLEGEKPAQLGDTMQDQYHDYHGDVYIWVSDMWIMNGTYGLKFEVVNIEVKNKLF